MSKLSKQLPCAGWTKPYLLTLSSDHYQLHTAEAIRCFGALGLWLYQFLDGSHIIEVVETNRIVKINGNVPNYGLIDNLPEACCVEVPCLVDGNGVQPIKVGELPAQLAALNRTMVNVQALIVEATLSGSRETILHAISLDPLTAAVCTLDQIRAMTDEMFVAQAYWLPQFA